MRLPILLLFCSSICVAAPTADQVLARYLKACGGEKFANLKTLEATGTLLLVGTGVKGVCKLYAKAPDKYRLQMEVPRFLKDTAGCTGDVAWQVNEIMGERMLEGKEKKYSMLLAKSDLLVKHRKYFDSVTIVGTERVLGKLCHVLRFQPKGGLEPFTYHFDKDSGLLLQQSGTMEGAQGKMQIRITFDKYTKVKGVMSPSLMTYHVMKMQFQLHLTRIEINTSVPNELFAFPGDLKPQIQYVGVDKLKFGEVTYSHKDLQTFLRELTSVQPEWKFELIALCFNAETDPYSALLPIVDLLKPYANRVALKKL